MSYALKHLAVTGLFIVIMVSATAGFAAANLTYRDLVKRYTDLERLAELPVEGEKCVQWSSWDRASKFDAETGKYVAWEANGDGGGFIVAEGTPEQVADVPESYTGKFLRDVLAG